MYRLRLDHTDWPHPTYSHWQPTKDFDKAIRKATELGLTWSIETRKERKP